MNKLLDLITGNGGLGAGEIAPVLCAPDQQGAMVDLAALYAAGPTLIYFYLRAGTPVCTIHTCRLRDGFDELRASGVQVVGVSADPPDALARFAENYGVPFRLLSDPAGAIARAFGLPVFFGMPARRAFLVRNGTIAWAGHASGAGSEVARRMAGDPRVRK